MDNATLCRQLGSPIIGRATDSWRNLYNEAKNRNLFTDSDAEAIVRQSIRVGMTQCAMYASWGWPDRENRTVSGSGSMVQHVYNAGSRYSKPKYIYTVNGIVRSFQD